MALRPVLTRVSPLVTRHAFQAFIQNVKPSLPALALQPCRLIHSTLYMSKKKGPIYVTMSQEQEVQVLGLDGEDLGMMTAIKAEEFARAGSMVLVMVKDKTKDHPVMRLFTGKDAIEEHKKEKTEKKAHAKRKEKRLHINTKIMDHDLGTKIQSTIKMLQRDTHVRVVIHSSVPGKEKQMVPLFQKFAEATKGLATCKQVTKKDTEMIIHFKPLEKQPPSSDAPGLLKNEELKGN